VTAADASVDTTSRTKFGESPQSSAYSSRGFAKTASPGAFAKGRLIDLTQDCEKRLEHTKGLVDRLVPLATPGSTTTSGFGARSLRNSRRGFTGEVKSRGVTSPFTSARHAEATWGEEAARLKDMIRGKEINIECDAQDMMDHLAGQTDVDLRRSIARVLEDAGVESHHLRGARKIVLKILNAGSAQVARDASKLFVRFAEAIRARMVGMTDEELLAASILLAEAAVRACAEPGDALATHEVKLQARSLREEIIQQVDLLRLGELAEGRRGEKSDAAKELERERPVMEEPRIKTVDEFKDVIQVWNSEEERLRQQLARAQQMIKDLLVEKEDQQAYLKACFHHEVNRLEGEKALAKATQFRLPVAMVQVLLKPKAQKAKEGEKAPGLVPPPKEQVRERVKQVIGGLLSQHGVTESDMSITSLQRMLNVIEVKIKTEASVMSICDTLHIAFNDQYDDAGVRGVCTEFADMKSTVVKVVWPLARVQADIDGQCAVKLPEGAIAPIEVPLDGCTKACREAWQKRLAAVTGDADEEKEAFAKLLQQPSNLPALGSLRQGARSLDELMDDAAAAHMQLKRVLARTVRWAQTAFEEKVAQDHASRKWRSPTNHEVFPNAIHFDPGIKPLRAVQEKADMVSRHDDEDKFRQVLDVSRLTVSFCSAEALAAALEHARSIFDIVWFDNRLKNPTCLGFRDLDLGVRQFVAATDDTPGREHISELRLCFEDLLEVRSQQEPRVVREILTILDDSHGLASEQLAAATKLTLRALEITEYKAHQKAEYQFAFVRPQLVIPHIEKDEVPRQLPVLEAEDEPPIREGDGDLSTQETGGGG